jgi:hypothetical protein
MSCLASSGQAFALWKIKIWKIKSSGKKQKKFAEDSIKFHEESIKHNKEMIRLCKQSKRLAEKRLSEEKLER